MLYIKEVFRLPVLMASLFLTGCFTPQFQLSEAAKDRETATGVRIAPETGLPKTPSVEYIRVRMTDSIFLAPPEEDKTSVYVRIRNTSGRNMDIHDAVVKQLRSRGYDIAKNASKATYVLQANVLFADGVSAAEIAKIDETKYGHDVNETIAGMASAGVTAAAAGALFGSGDIARDGAVGAVLGGLGSAFLQSQADKRVAAQQQIKYFSLIVDIQLQERAKGDVQIKGRSHLSASQHEGGGNFKDQTSYAREETQIYEEASNWKLYQTRVIGEAKGKLVAFEDVQEDFVNKLISSIAGLF